MFHDDLSTSLQRAALIALIWLLPYLGAVVVLHLLRQHPERTSGRYPDEREPGDDAGLPRQFSRNRDDPLENESSNSDAGSADD
ncbi:MAG: hypothetical protein ACKVQA_11635 [Burkholderiales bacterium]